MANSKKSSKKEDAKLLIGSGVGLCILSLLADKIGLGQADIFGYKQMILFVVGIGFVILGVKTGK